MSNQFHDANIEREKKAGLVTLKSIPKSAEFTNFKIGYVTPPLKLTYREFKQFLDTATLISADNPTVYSFHLSPMASGHFTTKAGSFWVELFLGGRGKITLPDRTFGWFDYKAKEAEKSGYPKFLTLDGRLPVTFQAIETSVDELQIVVFKVKDIDYFKHKELDSKSPDALYQLGKAKIQVTEVVFSENNRLKAGSELWINARRFRDLDKYTLNQAGNGLSVSGWGDEIILLQSDERFFIAMLVQKKPEDLWSATRIQQDVETSVSADNPLTGYRAKLRDTAKKVAQKR